MSPVFGQYVEGDGFAHRLDARVKLILLALVTAAAFGAASLGVVLALLAAAVVCALAAGVEARALIKAAVPAAVVLAFAFFANALVADGTGDMTLFGPVGVSWEGLARGVLVVARILALVAWCAVLSATTPSTDIADALVTFLRPLAALGVSVDGWAMTLALALRFLPDTVAELGTLRDARTARGVPLAGRSIGQRLRGWGSLLVPLTVGLFRRSGDVAEAMDDRCWGAAPRVHERRSLGAAGWLTLGCGIVLCVLCCVVGR